MNVYVCTNHDSHYPVGCSSVVVASDKEQARHLLDEALMADGLEPYEKQKYDLTILDLSKPNAMILCNGEY